MQALSSSRARAAFGSRPIAASTAPRRAVVVCVKPSKAAEFRALNNEEIVAKIGELKKEYVRLSYYQQTRGATLSPDNKEDPNPEKTPKGHEFKHTRRQIAQLWTVLRERQAASGLDRRQVQKLNREFAVANGFGRFK